MNSKKSKSKIIVDPRGQWAHPGKLTRIPSNDITMEGVNYPVWAQPNVGPGMLMEPGKDYNFPEADYVDEYPQMKKGGAKADKKYTRNITAMNKLFAENDLFRKPKKKQIFDPNASFYAEGGQSSSDDYFEMDLSPEEIQAYRDGGYVVQELPHAQAGLTTDWQEPNYINDTDKTGYDEVTGSIITDPNNSYHKTEPWLEHEKYHHLQNLTGNLSTARAVGQKPNNNVASDQAIADYYNRRNTELETETDAMIKADPNLQFIPRNKLQQTVFPLGQDGEEPTFVGADDKMYQDPSTVEGEARAYEQYIRQGGKSIFSQKKEGGALLTKKVTCKKCGWTWDAADGGNDMTTCHKCGGQGLIHAQEGGYKQNIKEIPSIPLMEGRTAYKRWAYGVNDKMAMEENGGFIELDLDDAEIENYRKGGYVVEQID